MTAWSTFLHLFGVEPRSPSTAYNFWSGFGSDITELGLIGIVWHHLNCHEDGCWRPGRHVVIEDGAHVRRCRKHHRAVRPV